MTQKEITVTQPLLGPDGRILEEGWARHPYWEYQRDAVHASTMRIKEWDYYYVISSKLKKGITVTLSDLGYAGLMALCWLDLDEGHAAQEDTIAPLTWGKLFNWGGTALSGHSSGNLTYADKKVRLTFDIDKGKRRLAFQAPELECPEGRGVTGELTLTETAENESINIATSWAQNRRRFYYNRKINCMSASGTVLAGKNEYQFEADTAFGGLDWGRGAWTYINRWFWSSASGTVNGKTFGFNLGYGFSDRTPATENIIFFGGVGHKIGEVKFHFNPDDYTAPWQFSDDEGRLDLDFKPIVDRSGAFNLLAIKSIQHQVFGYFSGRAKLDDGTVIEIKDFFGFAEDVYNRW